jgi:dCMP deaminase
MNVAVDISMRSRCARRLVGAVIVDDSNRIVATGYNGPPGEMVLEEGSCLQWCPRAMMGDAGAGYDNCYSVHAEANAIAFVDRRDRIGGTLYVTSSVCISCAKLISNSGIRRVVVRAQVGDEHRKPEVGKTIMRLSSVQVDDWDS